MTCQIWLKEAKIQSQRALAAKKILLKYFTPCSSLGIQKASGSTSKCLVSVGMGKAPARASRVSWSTMSAERRGRAQLGSGSYVWPSLHITYSLRECLHKESSMNSLKEYVICRDGQT